MKFELIYILAYSHKVKLVPERRSKRSHYIPIIELLIVNISSLNINKMSRKSAALVDYLMLAVVLLPICKPAQAKIIVSSTMINSASFNIEIVGGKYIFCFYLRIKNQNMYPNAGILTCDSKQCPATSSKCSVWRKNSVNDINTLTTYRKCFDSNGKTNLFSQF